MEIVVASAGATSEEDDAPSDAPSSRASVADASGVNVPSLVDTVVGVAVTVVVGEGEGVGVVSSTVGVPVTVCATDSVGVAVGVPLSGDGVAVGVSSGGSVVGGSCVGGDSVGEPGVGVRVGTVQLPCAGGIAHTAGITAKPDKANVMSSHPANIQYRFFIAHSPHDT